MNGYVLNENVFWIPSKEQAPYIEANSTLYRKLDDGNGLSVELRLIEDEIFEVGRHGLLLPTGLNENECSEVLNMMDPLSENPPMEFAMIKVCWYFHGGAFHQALIDNTISNISGISSSVKKQFRGVILNNAYTYANVKKTVKHITSQSVETKKLDKLSKLLGVVEIT